MSTAEPWNAPAHGIHTDLLSPGALCLVTTASGAGHLIDARAEAGIVTVTRVRTRPGATAGSFPVANLRRDGDPVRLVSVHHLDDDGAVTEGVRVGADMYLTLEPLAEGAWATVRRTTPVVSIEKIEEVVPGE